MRLRPYIKSRDFQHIAGWISDERSHALWCANNYPYPLTEDAFHGFMDKTMDAWAVCAYVVTEDCGKPVGFFRYSVNPETNVGFLASVIIDNQLRGKGYGQAVTQMALRYAFEFTGAEVVQLNVFGENLAAKRCYQKAGFAEKSVSRDAFAYKDEVWSMCSMAIARQQEAD